MNRVVIPNDIFFANLLEELKSGGEVLFTVRGHSMTPFLKNEKDSVMMKRFDPGTDELRRGDVALFRFKGNYVVHRCVSVLWREGRRVYEFRGDGNCSGWEWAYPENVYAVMSKKITPSGREWSCDSRSWKICSTLWPSGYWLRRLLLAVIHRLPAYR